jgi:hypothetical protein
VVVIVLSPAPVVELCKAVEVLFNRGHNSKATRGADEYNSAPRKN